MIIKKFLSLALLLALTGTAFVASEQNAEARCCGQRCHHRGRCNNGCGNGGYGYGGSNGCNTCGTGAGMSSGTYTAPAPTPDAAPAAPPAPST